MTGAAVVGLMTDIVAVGGSLLASACAAAEVQR
jgi:hypothetical protein